MALVGSVESLTTMALGAPLLGLTSTEPKRSSAWARSASCSVLRRRARRVVSSSLSDSSSPFSRWRCCRSSSIRWALVFLLAAAAALALASASSAFLAFSRSTSESSAASHESRTYRSRLVSLLGLGAKVRALLDRFEVVLPYFFFLFIVEATAGCGNNRRRRALLFFFICVISKN
jgi:hypothetical protein